MPNSIQAFREAVLSKPRLAKKLADWRRLNKKIVFTNGCFDLLHPGHVVYLSEAKGKGDILIIGLNSDDSVRRLKGPKRPLNDSESRAIVLAALKSVNAICVFNEDTPYDLINHIKPDILVKGGDYDPNVSDKNDRKYIVGSDIVKSYGGSVISIKFVKGYSTTSIINKMN